MITLINGDEISHTDFYYQKTKCVSFFFKLPYNIRIQYTPFFKEILPPDEYEFITHNAYCLDLIKNISMEKYKWIIDHTDDNTYYSFLRYYVILQPAIEIIVNANDLYGKYPEYLI